MRLILLGLLCLTVCTGAQCMQRLGGPKTINDAPPGSIVGQCARDGTLLIIDVCPNCRAACDFELTAYTATCKQCGQSFSAISCYSCKTNTHVSSGRFRLKEKK